MSQRLRFARFELDPAAGELRRGGQVRRLEPQPARVLAYLLAHAGEVVSREALHREIWGEETHVDFDRGLSYCIAQIRIALEDSASSPRFVETLPKRGYRFLVAPEQETVEAPSLASAAAALLAPGVGMRRRQGGKWAIAGLALLALFALFVAWYVARRGPNRTLPPTVAVTLFDDETAAGDGARLAQALSDAVVEHLARAPERWSVIGNAAVLRAPREQRDLAAIARELGADFIVLGQVQERDGARSVLTHLVRAADQKHLWVDRFALGPEGEAAWLAAVGRGVQAGLVQRQGGAS